MAPFHHGGQRCLVNITFLKGKKREEGRRNVSPSLIKDRGGGKERGPPSNSASLVLWFFQCSEQGEKKGGGEGMPKSRGEGKGEKDTILK